MPRSRNSLGGALGPALARKPPRPLRQPQPRPQRPTGMVADAGRDLDVGLGSDYRALVNASTARRPQRPTGMVPDAGRDLGMALAQPPQPAVAPQMPQPRPAPQPQGPRLARPLANPGSRGQNMRYDIRGLQRGERGWTDGVYWYDDNGLSLDRPDSPVAGLPAADENYEDWWMRNPGGGGPGGGFGGGGGGSAAGSFDIASLLGPPGSDSPAYGGMQDLSPQLLDYLLSLLGRVPGRSPAA